MKQRGNGIFEVEDSYLWRTSGWTALHCSVILLALSNEMSNERKRCLAVCLAACLAGTVKSEHISKWKR
jgi:hypothetical protein